MCGRKAQGKVGLAVHYGLCSEGVTYSETVRFQKWLRTFRVDSISFDTWSNAPTDPEMVLKPSTIEMTNPKPKYDLNVLAGLKRKEQGELPLLTALTPERAHCARAMRDACGAFKGLTKKLTSWSSILP